MAFLSTTESLKNINVKYSNSVISANPSSNLKDLDTAELLYQSSRQYQKEEIKFIKSSDERGICLQSLTLKSGFEGFFSGWADQTNELYCLAIAWDLGGNISIFPDKETIIKCLNNPSEEIRNKVIWPRRVDDKINFLGDGILLFPKQKVTGGINLRIQIYESDNDFKEFGKTLNEINNTIENSQLKNLLSLLSPGANVAALDLIQNAASDLFKFVGGILTANSDDYVDCLEGFFPASNTWNLGIKSYSSTFVDIELNLF